MMITESYIRTLVEDKIEGSDQFIVSLKVSSSNKIKVFLDAVGGLNVTDCIAVSRHIEGSLDRDVEDFELEVSSPGLAEPFAHPLQYKKNIGRTIKVLTTEGKHIKGELTAFNGEDVIIQPEKKKKKQEVGPIELPLSEIKEAKTVISFK